MRQARITLTGRAAHPLPALGHGLWVDRLDDGAAVAWAAAQLAPTHLDLLADLRLPGSFERLRQALAICAECGAQAWLLVIVDDVDPRPTLQALATCLERAPLRPAGVLVTPAAYLDSYQPDAQWPTGVSPQQVLALAREALPGMAIGAGVPTYFTELNRCRPEPGSFDYLTHATSPIVHAADDRSVIESLQALPDIFRCAQALANGRPYRLTTSAIGAWRNPYGGQLTPNPHRERLTLSDRDPRQQSLLAAAWTLGHYAAAHGGGVQASALWALNEPFAVAEAGRYWPVFHLLRALAGGRGQPALGLHSTAAQLVAVGWELPGGQGVGYPLQGYPLQGHPLPGERLPGDALPGDALLGDPLPADPAHGSQPPKNAQARLCLANLSTQPLALSFAGMTAQHAAVLDAGHYPQALDDPLWLQRPGAPPAVLEPFAVAVVDCTLDVEPAFK